MYVVLGAGQKNGKKWPPPLLVGGGLPLTGLFFFFAAGSFTEHRGPVALLLPAHARRHMTYAVSAAGKRPAPFPIFHGTGDDLCLKTRLDASSCHLVGRSLESASLLSFPDSRTHLSETGCHQGRPCTHLGFQPMVICLPNLINFS